MGKRQVKRTTPRQTPVPAVKVQREKKNIPRYGPIISQAHARVFTITRVHGAVDRCAPQGGDGACGCGKWSPR